MMSSDGFGWTFYARGSVNGSRYHVVNKVATYYAAQEQCRQLGGYLARVNSIREQVFLEDFLKVQLRVDGESFLR